MNNYFQIFVRWIIYGKNNVLVEQQNMTENAVLGRDTFNEFNEIKQEIISYSIHYVNSFFAPRFLHTFDELVNIVVIVSLIISAKANTTSI